LNHARFEDPDFTAIKTCFQVSDLERPK
jgi:hypothetical protein